MDLRAAILRHFLLETSMSAIYDLYIACWRSTECPNEKIRVSEVRRR